ncbi:MAG TPA: NAD-dependent epimerase/dehydratase family protein [Myxococcota bacterium]|nr:NAD-dependent epimerase/dehydratase family protein [Myxococcota bacterium]
MKKVLITGISGGQGRLLARRLMDRFEICGIDRVRWDGHPRGVRLEIVDLRKKKVADVFRSQRPSCVVHMGFIEDFRVKERERHDVNVTGTKQLLDHCVRHGVESLVVLSSGYVYGAIPENPYRIDEDSPLSASRSYPEIRDRVEVDALVTAFLWRYPQIRTCVLRPVNVLGYYAHSMISAYLRERRVPTVMGFDPMMQFIHEEDLSAAIALAVDHRLQGVFNVTGPGEVPLRVAIREAGAEAWPIPEPILRALFRRLFRMGLSAYPSGAIDFLKFPITLAGERFIDATGFAPHFGLRETLLSVRG